MASPSTAGRPLEQSRSLGVYSEALGSWRGWGERAGAVHSRAGRPGDRGATVSIHPDSQQHRTQAWSPPWDREPTAFPGAWSASSIRRPPAPRATPTSRMLSHQDARLPHPKGGRASASHLAGGRGRAHLAVAGGGRCGAGRGRALQGHQGHRGAGPAPGLQQPAGQPRRARPSSCLPPSLPRPPPPPRPPGPQHAGSDAHAPVAGLGRAPPRGHVHPRAPPRRLQQSSPGHTSEARSPTTWEN